MFLEVELGQHLGPRPEWGNQHVVNNLDIARDIQIPQPRVSEMQRYFGHRDFLIEQIPAELAVG